VVVKTACKDLGASEGSSSGEVERWLRGSADALIEAHHLLLDRIRAAHIARRVAQLLDGQSTSPGPTRPARMKEVAARRRETRLQLRAEFGPDEWSPEEVGIVLHIVELLTWADEMAPDDYSYRGSDVG